MSPLEVVGAAALLLVMGVAVGFALGRLRGAALPMDDDPTRDWFV